jgi:phosphoribosyl-ATP pyrophosphohydrolase/phosphoribosyl-AMP cyclohydrolase/histidinol dehydrogenase
MKVGLLKILRPDDASLNASDPVDRKTLEIAREIVDAVRAGGEPALRRYAAELNDLADPRAPLVCSRDELRAVLDEIDPADRALLERVAGRIERFAAAQRGSIREFELDIPGGRAGQVVSPVERAGCYAPGGRFPLPSSVLMTAVTARAAGVGEVWVASPRPTRITLAAAAVAGAAGLLKVGGAQAIAAMAFGAGPVPVCDVVVGPGNRFVTAAKQLVSGRVGIDMLAGPSELTVLADDTADPAVVAADLLAQAEHDPDAVPILVSTSPGVIDRVNEALEEQLAVLPTRETASAALKNGFAVLADSWDAAVETCNRLAPEHLELHVQDAGTVSGRCRHFGALFIGQGAAEVLGDYGAGPNHTLPTGGTARHAGGLSVFDFLRIRTTLAIDDAKTASALAEDAVALARLEGLEAHARAAEKRIR